MRFNDVAHLKSWKAKGVYPSIHDSIFSMVTAYAVDGNVLDLCCGLGLLTQRLKATGFNVIGIDASESELRQAKDYGIDAELIHMKIDTHSINAFFDLIEERQIDIIVARRAFPEILSSDAEFCSDFVERLGHSRIKQIFIQGRLESSKTTNTLGSVKAEVELFKKYFSPKILKGQLAIIRRIKP